MPAISPKDITAHKRNTIPEFVFDVFNELIAADFSGSVATVKQNAVIERILADQIDLDRQTIFSRGWLNIEDVYEQAGWKVVYDKPYYNETYEAYWMFKKK